MQCSKITFQFIELLIIPRRVRDQFMRKDGGTNKHIKLATLTANTSQQLFF